MKKSLGDQIKIFNNRYDERTDLGKYTKEYYKKQLESIKNSIDDGARINNGKSSYRFLPRDVKEELTYSCNKWTAAIIYSPVISLGSGNCPIHKDCRKSFVFRTTVNVELPKSNKDLIKEDLRVNILEENSLVSYGDTLISLKYKTEEYECEEIIATWNNLMIGLLESVEEVISDRTGISTFTFRFKGIINTDAEKIRGITIKARTTSLCRNLRVVTEDTEEEVLIFDNNEPLKGEDESLNQVEILLTTEEAKTANAALSLVSPFCAFKKKPIIYDRNGFFWNLKEGIKEIENHTIKVKVDRWNLEDSFYLFLKDLYEGEEDFEFIDKEKRVIHRNVIAIVGILEGKIELPLTATFFGSVSTYSDALMYFGLDNPKLLNYLIETQQENIEKINRHLKSVNESFNYSGDIIEILKDSSIIDESTLITIKRTELALLTYRNDNFLSKIIMPPVSSKGLNILDICNKRFKRKSWFLFLIGDNLLLLDINLVTRSLIGDTRLKQLLISLFKEFETDLEERDKDWILRVIKNLSLIKTILQGSVIIGDSIFKSISRSKRIFNTARVITTTDGYIKTDELHISPITLELLKIKDLPLRTVIDKEGNRIENADKKQYLAGVSRVPVSGYGQLKVIENHLVPPFMVALSAITMAYTTEGDSDGDNLQHLIVEEGTDLIIESNLVSVNLLDDN
ncbi:hypothetical protein V6O07_23850 [Arthrospira platensis SPKY2]